jgi:hypothetical protein
LGETLLLPLPERTNVDLLSMREQVEGKSFAEL